MAGKLTLFDEFLDDVHVNQTVLRGIANEIRRFRAFETLFNRAHPEFAYLNHTPV